MAIPIIIGVLIILFLFVVSQHRGRRYNVSICKNRLDGEFKKSGFINEKSMAYRIPLHETDIFIDSTNKRIALCEYSKDSIIFFDFASILDCEIIEDDIVAKGGLGRAIVGGAIAGGAGAVVGVVTAKEKQIVKSLKIKLTTDDPLNALKIIELLNIQVNKNSDIYKKAIGFATETHTAISSIMKA